MGKLLPDTEKKFLLRLKPEDITFSLLIDLFADKSKKKDGKLVTTPSRMNSSDVFFLEEGEYFNKGKIRTNAGLFIFNKLIVERELQNVLGYVNETIDSKVLGKIEGKLSKARLLDKITQDDFVNYLNRIQWLAMQAHPIFCGSFSMKTLKPNKKVIQLREKLLKENEEMLKKGDVITATKIEKQLLDLARQENKGDHGMFLYDSGARGSFGNNYKNIAVMKGPVFNPVTGEFDVVRSNFMEGIRKDEIPIYGNAIITGAYPKAIGTATAGYFSKQIIAALQAVSQDEKGSDCKSKGFLSVLLEAETQDDFLYRYIIEDGKLVFLNDDNIGSYTGKIVKMRSPMFCVGKKLCRVCAGLMYEMLGIDHIGLTSARVSSTLLNLSMKKFHDSTTQLTDINIDDLVI